MPILYPQAPDMAASDPRLDYSPLRRHIPCIHFRQQGGCKNGDACAFAHDPFLTMPQEYVDSQTKLYSHPPELIVEADPDVIVDNAIQQRRPMDASWYRPEATVNQYPRQLIRRYNQQEYDMELDPLAPTIAGLQRWAPGWGSPEAFYDIRQHRPDYVYAEDRADRDVLKWNVKAGKYMTKC